MEHLHDTRLMEAVYDDAALTADELAHLAQCHDCRRAHVSLQTLASELDVARASAVSVAAEARYAGLFTAARQGAAQTPWKRAAAWIYAQLAFDSRAQALAAGVRSSASTNYRLLFAADQAEVELMVEPVQARRRLMGELVEVMGGLAAPALVELAQADGKTILEAVTDEQGRFLFNDLPTGQYTLTIIQVEPLEIT
jgi:hypothetical protein